MGDGIEEAVLLLVAPHFAHQKNSIEDDAGDDEAEENYAQDEGNDLAPVEDDPTDIEHRAQREATSTPRVMANAIVFLRLVMRMGWMSE